MRALVVVGVALLAMVGPARMQQPGMPQNGNLLGNLLGGLGLTGQQQQRQGLLDGLLGGLTTPNQGLMNGLGGMNGMNGMNHQQALGGLTRGLTDTLGQMLNQGSSRQGLPSMNQGLPGMNQGFGMNQGMSSPNGLSEMLSQIPRRAFDMVQQVLSGVSRMLPGGQDQMGRNQRLPAGLDQFGRNQRTPGNPMDILDERALRNMTPEQLQNLSSMVQYVTNEVQNGRVPDVSQLTRELSQALGGLGGLGQGGMGQGGLGQGGLGQGGLGQAGQQLLNQFQQRMRNVPAGPQSPRVAPPSAPEMESRA